MISKGLALKLRYDDADLAGKVARLKAAAQKNPGRLPLKMDVAYDDGTTVSIDLGPLGCVACTIDFMSELAKVVHQSDTSLAPEDKTTLVAPPEPVYG